VADFPMNVLETVTSRMELLLPDFDAFLARPLRPSDPARSFGMFPVDWMPRDESWEMSGFGPTLSRYLFRVQVLVKHTDELEGRATYAEDAKNVRLILHRDVPLRTQLASLNETSLGGIERLQRFGIRNQRYLNNELQGQFIYLASTEFWVETETIQT
jgi:hypothetical protein